MRLDQILEPAAEASEVQITEENAEQYSDQQLGERLVQLDRDLAAADLILSGLDDPNDPKNSEVPQIKDVEDKSVQARKESALILIICKQRRLNPNELRMAAKQRIQKLKY